jgi:hypothetical protein
LRLTEPPYYLIQYKQRQVGVYSVLSKLTPPYDNTVKQKRAVAVAAWFGYGYFQLTMYAMYVLYIYYISHQVLGYRQYDAARLLIPL